MHLKRLLKTILLPMLLFCTVAFAQEKTVSGKVTDSKSGVGIPGISVTIKGKTAGTQTSVDGSYILRVPAGTTTLVFSSVGFATQEVAIANASSVKLEATAGDLNNVVVIGYGSTRKKDLTGSVATVSSKDFVKGAITTPEQLISGKVAGVAITSNGGAPGAGSTIRIRGGASLNASNDPLIVVDGMPLDNGGIAGVANPLSLINPNDIESFSILKDASATAIYGSRASNGVIIITTKKGRKGSPVFNFSSQLSVSKISKEASVLTADQVRQTINGTGNANLIGLLGTANTDWQSQIYKTALAEDNNLSVAGSVGAVPYRVSLGFLNQDGILKTGNLRRESVGINISPLLFDNHLKIDLNMRNSFSNSRFANEGAIGSAVNFDPTKPVFSGNNRFGGYWEWLDGGSTTGLKSLAPLNPLGILMQREDKSSVQRSVGNAVLDYKLHFFPDLHAVLNVGYDASKGTGTIVINDSAASSYRRSPDTKHGGVNNQYKQTKSNTYFNFYLNYAKDIKTLKTRIEALAGYEFQDYKTTNYNFNDNTYDGTVISTPTNPFNIPESRIKSYLGRATLNVLNRYILTGSIRRDGSSKFNPNNRWANFPSAAFAWKIIEEPFLNKVKALTELKLRVGYGITGQQDGIGLYDYISYYNLSNQQAEYQLGNNFYQSYRPGGYYFNRKWEQTATSNIALDYGLFGNRITGTIEYYYKKTTDLLNSIDQPAGTNFSNTIVANVGSMENRGVEFSINVQPIRNKNVTWDIAFNATYNQNKITKLQVNDDPAYAGVQYGGISGGVGNTILIQSLGLNRGSFYVYKQVYDPKTGNPIEGLFDDKNRDGVVNSSDRYQYKGVDPKSFYGLSSNLSYKKWNAGFVARANLGNYLYNNVAASTGRLNNIVSGLGIIGNANGSYLTTGFTGVSDKQLQSDYYVENASFIRLDNINVGYNAGKVFNNKASLRFSANVQNVFTISKYSGLDPEVNGGIDNNFYPRPRTFVLGLNLDF